MRETYESPLGGRYAGREMQRIFSDRHKFTLWRKLWIALAKAERDLGLPVTDAQISEMETNLENIDFDLAAQYEKKLRHDVMAHIHAWGDICPLARPIIHLGATSCYVGDNADALIIRDALNLVAVKLAGVISNLATFAKKYKSVPTLGFTHFQPAQPTTVGKRATLWAQDFLLDLEETETRISRVKLLGSKGTTGTQASFLELFGGDHGKVRLLEEKIAQEFGMEVFAVTGQTYSRKQDAFTLNALSGIAQSASKMATDIRLLSNLKEIEEPFEKNQVGSSAMPYKRNPMRSERVCSLSRFVISAAQNPAYTAATQWLERTLDDSANRRLSIAEAFLAADGILDLCLNITDGLIVNERVIGKNLLRELPFMATENILMDAVKRGADRQEVHEKIREASVAAGLNIKGGGENNLFELLDLDFDRAAVLDPALYVGRAPEQVGEFVDREVVPALEKYKGRIVSGAEIRV